MYSTVYVFARGDCFIRLVCTYTAYLHPIKAHDRRAYFGLVSKSRVNRIVTLQLRTYIYMCVCGRKS